MVAMPRLLETETRTGTLVAAINHVLASKGPAGLTMRAIAAESRVSTSSMLHHFGTREHLLIVAAHRTANAWIARIEQRLEFDGVAAFLPGHDDEVVDARAWLGWLEMWRSDDVLDHAIRKVLDGERALLAVMTDYELTRDQLDLTIAVIDGLRSAICSPVRPLPRHRATALLVQHLRATARDL
jgi:TetR/AcrR family transcriptional repressor of bet genes